ncbi:rhodanese-like domain-containing protein [Paraburkholderia sp.]|uniref:rhodanese-like domain-containing protein n=1 Tax=Paraburkholderia sp. TaxID=1926495 RepID=UPI0023A41A8F|nr:rhodanese-like domain-containing protein [Paraburkholderia sp.]MDE1182283.1 rhodanese-like domain-containing protein [Paraburkholderia sp.]
MSTLAGSVVAASSNVVSNDASNDGINSVTAVTAADAASALAHFEASLRFETDCADVSSALQRATPGFVLLDVRGPALFAQGHVPGAINLPHGKIVESKLTAFAPGTLFVTYCAGPHCNGATRGAIRLARLGRPVKIMIGGVTGWLDEGFELAVPPRPDTAGSADR